MLQKFITDKILFIQSFVSTRRQSATSLFFFAATKAFAKAAMFFGQKLLLLVYGIHMVLVVAGERDHFPYDGIPVKVQLVNKDEAVNENTFTLQTITPIIENDGETVDLLFYKSQESEEARNGEITVCICMHTSDRSFHNTKTQYCSEFSRICFKGAGQCHGEDEEGPEQYCSHYEEDIEGKKYFKYHVSVKKNTATVERRGENTIVLDISPVSYEGGQTNPKLSIGLVAFYAKQSGDCNDKDNALCKHLDVLYYKHQEPQLTPAPAVIEKTEKPVEPKPATKAVPPPLPLVPATTKESAPATASFPILYVCLGILGAIIIIIIIICVLRCVQGIWCCGLLCFKQREESEDENIKKKYKFPGSKEANNKGDGPNEIQIIEGKKAEEILQGSNEMKVTFEDRQFVQNTQPTQTTGTEEQKKKPLVSRETKDTPGNEKTDEKDSDGETDGATSGATTNQATTTTPAATAEKKKVRAPNMLLVATKEDDTQSEGQIPSKRKTKVEKNNKEPAATKNVTQDPGAPATKGIATGKPATTTMKTGLKRTEAQTGIPKSETDLATDKGGPAATKGVSATQGDKVTENYETRPTQQTATMATGAAKLATTLGTTQLGTQTTQGGATTAGGKTQTGIAKTRLTGPTQLPSSDTNETQIPTGATKTKPTQFPTGATKTKTTQFATGATQKLSTGTTQAGTGTTQRGTTMATGLTQAGTAATQARTSGTRQTGETQNPEEADIDIDPTQFAGTTVGGGGSRPTVAGTQMPSNETDPTQNPTAFIGGEGGGIKTSKTQFGTTAGTKTRTRETQKQTKQTDAAL